MSVSPLDLFIRASDALIKFNAKFSAIADDAHTLFKLEVQAGEVERLWTSAKNSYSSVLDYLATSKTADIDEVDVIENKYDVTFDAYVKCLASINERLHAFRSASRHDALANAKSSPNAPSEHLSRPPSGTPVMIDNIGDVTPTSAPPAPVADNLVHNLVLPPCDTEIFHGDYLSWPTFRDLFTAVYINNSRLSEIERLCHLHRKTTGEAREIIAKFPLTNSSFRLAWRALESVYDNTRLLVNNQLMILFELPAFEKETHEGLKTLRRGFNGCLSAMATYHVSTADWDPLLVFMCIRRLPKSVVALWEHTIKNKTILSTWHELDEFLMERIQTLECVRDLTVLASTTKTDRSGKVKSHVTKSGATDSSRASGKPCVLCKQNHVLRNCPQFKVLSVSDRFSAVKRHNLCTNCLSQGHVCKDCKSAFSCSVCNKKHHTLLHRETSSALTTAVEPVVASTSTGLNRQVFHTSNHGQMLLGTAMVNIIHKGTSYLARALIDPASEATFISERLRNLLRLPVTPTSTRISGVDDSLSAVSRNMCALTVGSPLDISVALKTFAFVLPRVTGDLPSFRASRDLKSQLPDLRLADANLLDCRPVDILLGADLYPQIVVEGIRRNILGSLLAQNSIFGWIITGPVNAHTSSDSMIQAFSTRVEFTDEDNLNQNLLRFWEMEETPKKRWFSPSDKYCEENFKATCRRRSDGRYIVSLPFKPEFPQNLQLGDSRSAVLKQFLRGEQSLLRKPEIKSVYDNVIREYLDLGHMRPVERSLISGSGTSCYLPHHPVINPEKKTTKLRVVFNASHKTTNGVSLNDLLYVGPTLQADLLLLILKWRLYRYVFNCDITQMYRQILVNPAHTAFQRILFRDSPSRDVQDFELLTVTFGVNCAPYLAIRVLLQLADDCESEYPLAANILRKNMYVDDVLTGTHDLDLAIRSRDQLIDCLATAGFVLRKWTANEKLILDRFSREELVDEQLLAFVETSGSKPLGILWNAQLDVFYFNVEPIKDTTSHTKRTVLSVIARLFDPIGWLAPVIIVAKMLMQRLWLDQIEWDDPLPSSTELSWKSFIETYHEVNAIQIPRWIGYTPMCVAELHVFSDASEKAYAGVIYLRIETPDGKVEISLQCSKTRVAPVKSVSLPRLELCGAVVASELLKTTLSEIGIPLRRVYCWTDSTIVLSWLKKPPCTWSTFVANRVCRIQENVGNHNWYHVKSEDNPADLGSRGVTPSALAESNLWWHGPHWLTLDNGKWPINDVDTCDTELEKRAIKSHFSFFESYEDILDRFSSLDRAMRVIANIFRFYQRTHPTHKIRYVFRGIAISNDEIVAVRQRLALLAQKKHFAREYKCLIDRTPLPSTSSLITLSPMLDDNGLMRLNGRLARSPTLCYSEKHPILLPYNCRFFRLLVEFIHLISMHGGNQLMLRLLRMEYWVPRMKTMIRAVVRGCKSCIIDRRQTAGQIMAALPPERTTLDRPFSNTGVDFAGPLDIKLGVGRSTKIGKGYVCVFVCFSTKAIHLEATSDLTTEAFLAAFQRFVARRGCPNTIFSDNGTNFVGASRELAREFKSVLQESRLRIDHSGSHPGITWRFIPAGSPHMGGLWEAAVKSFKMHFRKHAQSCKYTFEELSTLLARIEACLNSRPLCPMSENPQDIVALTPGHFLIGAPLLAPPESRMPDHPLDLVNRFRKMKALAQEMCVRWKEEYLHQLQTRYKWKHPHRDVCVDDLVVVKNEQLPPTSWKLGRVIRVCPGTDGHVRVADIRTENGIMSGFNELPFFESFMTDEEEAMLLEEGPYGEIDAANASSSPVRKNSPTSSNSEPSPAANTLPPAQNSVRAAQSLCLLCPREHHLSLCRRFKRMGVVKRLRFVRANRLCLRCLCLGTPENGCSCDDRCSACQGEHHQLLHSARQVHHRKFDHTNTAIKRGNRSPRSAFTPAIITEGVRGQERHRRQTARRRSQQQVATERRDAMASTSIAVAGNPLGLPIAHFVPITPTMIVQMLLSTSQIPVRAVLDTAGTSSQICSTLVRRLHLPTEAHGRDFYCRLTVASSYDLSKRVVVTAKVRDMTMVVSPRESLPERLVEEFEGFPLADPRFYRSSGVALVFGPETIRDVLRNKFQPGHAHLSAQLTIFGWAISGCHYQ